MNLKNKQTVVVGMCKNLGILQNNQNFIDYVGFNLLARTCEAV